MARKRMLGYLYEFQALGPETGVIGITCTPWIHVPQIWFARLR